MSDKSRIEWTDATWNPTTGCDRVSPGCDHCYALDYAARLKATGSRKYQNDGNPITSGPGFGLTLHPDTLDVPRRWKEPKRVFVNSMSDLFHDAVPLSFIQQVFTVMRETPRHTYQILTKRAVRLQRIASQLDWPDNVWMGVSVEAQEQHNRVSRLMGVPAVVRFLSCEPLLGPLDLRAYLRQGAVHWVIVGGESGPGYRPCNYFWVTQIRGQCQDAGIPFFFKQWGGRTPKAGGRELDGRTWDEFPGVSKKEVVPLVSAPSIGADNRTGRDDHLETTAVPA